MIYPTEHPASDASWRNRAVCARPDVNEEFWYATDLGSMTSARAICADCTVRTPCLREGLYDQHGIWAGWTPTERARLAKRLPNDPRDVPAFLDRAATFGPVHLRLADTTHPERNR